MNLNSLTRTAKTCGLLLKKHASTIEFVAGCAAVVGGTVLLVKSANDIADVNNQVEDHKRHLKEIDEDEDGWEGMDETRGQYIRRCFVQDTVDYTKAIWKAAGLMAVGITMFGLSHATITKQLKAVSASLAATSLSYSQYRQRVREDVGEEKDYQYLTGGCAKTVEVKKDGTVIETTIPINGDDKTIYIPHSMFFDEHNVNWRKDPSRNMYFLKRGLVAANRKLERDGFIFENDIWKLIGGEACDMTVAGQSAGFHKSNPDGSTNQISFGFEANTEAAKRFRDGLEPSFLVILQYTDGRPADNNVFDYVTLKKY